MSDPSRTTKASGQCRTRVAKENQRMDAMDAAAYPNDAEDGKSCGYLCDDYDERMQTPHLSRSFKEQELLQKILGLTKEQKKRARALSKLGVTEEDLNAAERIFLEAAAFCSLGRKEEKVLGYSLEQIKREKALERLGVTQEQIEFEACKNLGSLGVFDGGGQVYNSKLCLPSDVYRASWIHDTSGQPQEGGFSQLPELQAPYIEHPKRTSPRDTSGTSSTVLSGLRNYIDKKRRSLHVGPIDGLDNTVAPTAYQELYHMYAAERRWNEKLEREVDHLQKQLQIKQDNAQDGVEAQPLHSQKKVDRI